MQQMVDTRIERLLAALAPQADAMLVSSQVNIRYCSGFTGEGALLLWAGGRILLTDPRYDEQATQQAPGFDIWVFSAGSYMAEICRALSQSGARRIAFEEDTLTYADFQSLHAELAGRAQLVPSQGACAQVRLIKDEYEIQCMRKACALTDDLFAQALTLTTEGATEREVVAQLHYYMAAKMGSAPSFETIYASGANGSMPHAITSDKALCPGDMITLDFGATWQGYHADMTRTFALGQPSEQMCDIYAIVQEAQRRAYAAAGPGVACREVDAAARDYITAQGYGERFGHGTGHGVGLQIHEEPRLNTRSQAVLRPGMIITIEPGIYLPGIGGVRIEDTCLITESGCESLFTATKDMIKL